MLTLWTDTYVTLEDADNYVKSQYKTNNELRKNWDALADEDKEVLLRNSTLALDRLKYTVGRKKGNQKFQFPRIANYGLYGISYIPYVSQFFDSGLVRNAGPYGDEDGTVAIAQATIVNALYANLYTEDVQESYKIKIGGVTSKKMGNVSKTYSTGINYNNELAQVGIYTKEVFSILVDWKPSTAGTL